ncbi:MAG: glycosyltransferase [Synergistaceae bacterium]|jgi:hypothetical protein|nr:glycosyltransferase [Synergistaceae bacterium]
MGSQDARQPAPVAFFVYNRPDHTRRTLEALRVNRLASASSLIVFSDGAKNEESAPLVEQVRQYIDAIDGFAAVTVVRRDKNYGLSGSIIDGVTQVVEQYGKIIVLEDDLITSPYFLDYVNDGLELYENVEEVASVNAYMYPIGGLPDIFFLRAADCWGWGTWKRAWKLFVPDGVRLLKEIVKNDLVDTFNFYGSYSYLDMLRDQINGKNDSWAIRWSASVLLQKRLGLYVGKSMVWNIGFDGSGVHCGHAPLNRYGVPSERQKVALHLLPLAEDKMSAALVGKYISENFSPPRGWKGVAKRILGKLANILSGEER